MMVLFISILLLLGFTGCTETSGEIQDWPWQDTEVEQPQTPEDVDEDATLDKWADVSANYGSLPEYIKVYKSPEKLEGKLAVAYVAIADMKSAEWDIWSINDSEMSGTTDSFKTPSTVYAEGSWPIVVNAGFFYSSGGKNYSSSLAVRNSEVLAYNINYASEDWVTIYYPTRAAFLETEDGDFDACWTYYKSGGKHYMYPSPSDNTWEARPAKTPSVNYPEGAETFAAKTAIGGGPLLIDGGKFKDTYVEELFNGASGIGPDTNQPRTAIGVTSDQKMIIFVCEGRQMTEGVAGLTTADVANVLLDLGCVEAINLDGGGSSCMLVNGKTTIKVSDGSQRAVASTIMIK